MPENSKISQIQLSDVVYDVQGKSLENQNTAVSAIADKYDWVGTVEQYQEQRVSELHPDWVCYITNDIQGNGVEVDLRDYVKKTDYNQDMTNVVHKSENENITGTKTFIENDSQIAFKIKSKIADDTETPVNHQHTDFIENCDKNGNALTRIFTVHKTDGSNGICLQAVKGTTDYILGVDSAGNSVAPSPAATSSTSDKNIALTGWVNDPAKSTNVVHRSDDETIAGIKNFTDPIKMNTNFGILETSTTSGDNSKKNFTLSTTDENGIKSASIGLHNNSGNPYVSATASDALQSIVTTEGISKSPNGYVKLGNGLIIQWGQTPTITTQGQTVNLPTAFTTTDYAVTATMNSSSGSDHCSCHSFTTTSFKMNVGAAGYTYNFIAIGY